MGLAALISTFLTSVGADITTFLGGVSSLVSDRRLKSDVVMVDWSRGPAASGVGGPGVVRLGRRL